MGLSSDLISQFVKITNDSKKKSKESTVYGTVRNNNGKFFVQLDGSSLLTPVTATTFINDGDRVTVLIKNHSAIVTGNISSPSASNDSLKDLSHDLGLIGGDLEGISGNFDLLVQSVETINDNLTAVGNRVTGLQNLTAGISITPSGAYALNGLVYGTNKVLWEGGMWMNQDQKITLSEPISRQTTGVVIIFCGYNPTTNVVEDWDFSSFFIPKEMVRRIPGGCHTFTMSKWQASYFGVKRLYINDSNIAGEAANEYVGATQSGITLFNQQFVLRYVIGM